jgi:hypothetical protein
LSRASKTPLRTLERDLIDIVERLYREGGMTAVAAALDRVRKRLNRIHTQGQDGWIC